ncbi:hypothetical protein ACIPSE_23325 [Streptomyces sp. NPDC090106]|uniref:hypothetical protein n=1 Tax=Streptomyces sp. NPDC090106 TaxID=3365946 RepID=UPI0037FDB3A2
MSAHPPTTTTADSPGLSLLLQAVPPLLTGALTLLLHTSNADQVAAVAAGVFTLVVAGWPFLQRSVNADCRRAAGPPGQVTRLTGPAPRVTPSTTTVVLTVALGVAVLWLLDLLCTWMGMGSLGYWSGDYPTEPSEVYRAVVLRGLLVLLPGVFVVAVAMAHRLHEVAHSALLVTSVLYTVAVLVTNLVLVRHWHTEPMAEDVYVPLALGASAWLVCLAGRRYALRTQALFDLTQAVRVEWRRQAAGRGR